ncbi:hypothetical protein C8J57DRAFT_1281660 [Mycena rebaudengoi]|nr:hypothetical protein C8J57DRAFT_1281660 [Mycena rebaudengoi]
MYRLVTATDSSPCSPTMTMPEIPQELLDDIVCELDDLDSLKACSLAGSILRYPCQRVLLRSLTVMGLQRTLSNPKGYAAAARLLRESPHIAGYVSRLKISLGRPPPDSDFNDLYAVLARLRNVQRCSVRDSRTGGRWQKNFLPPELVSALVEFFSRQPLLHLEFLRLEGLPPILFLGVTPSLLFDDVSTPGQLEFSPPAHRCNLEQLVLTDIRTRSEHVYDLLALPQLRSWTAARLRRLSIDPQFTLCPTLVSAAASTLEYICFECTEPYPAQLATIPLPPLPALRIVHFFFGSRINPISCLLDVISQYILAPGATPALRDVVITYRILAWDPPVPEPNSLAALDAALATHPRAPPILWRFNFVYSGGARHCTAFKDVLKAGLPKMQESARLMFEDYTDKESLVYTDKKFVGDNWRFLTLRR